MRFHPLARDVVVTSAYDFTLKIWDLQDNTVKIDITCHPDQVCETLWYSCSKLKMLLVNEM